MLAGCHTTARIATEVPAEQATPQAWLSQPAVATATADDFDALWQAAQRSAQALHFEFDLQNPRQGLMTTLPMVGGQWFEPWRRENRTAMDVLRSNTATYRRTIHFVFRSEGDAYVVEPRVLLEREALRERRLTSPLLYRGAFGRRRERGTREQDLGLDRPDRYWYAVGRDEHLEKSLVAMIDDRL